MTIVTQDLTMYRTDTLNISISFEFQEHYTAIDKIIKNGYYSNNKISTTEIIMESTQDF